METINISDVIISASSVKNMQSFDNWSIEHRYIDEEIAFYKNVWVDDNFTIYGRPTSKKQKHIKIRLLTDFIYRMKSMFFYIPQDDKPEEINQNSELGFILRANVLCTFDRFGFLSYEKDIKKVKIKDFPSIYEYFQDICKNRYHVEIPESVIIHYLPCDLWSTIYLDKGAEAAYMPMLDSIFTSNKKYKSQKWFESLIVHELIHSIQKRKKWMLTLKDLGITDFELEQIVNGIKENKSIEEIASKLNRSKKDLLRAKGFIDNKIEYATKYFESPVEVNAWAEQFEYVKSQGVSADKIEVAFFEYIANKGGIINSDQKTQLHKMIHNSKEMIEKSTETLNILHEQDKTIVENYN